MSVSIATGVSALDILNPSTAAAVVGAAGGNGLKTRIVGYGDSLTLYNNFYAVPTSIVRVGGVSTVTVSQNSATGSKFCMTGNTPASFNANGVAVTRLSATTFSYVNAGPDESATAFGHTTNLGFFTNISPFLYANSALNGALQWVKNFGVGGQTSAQILSRISDVLAVGPTGSGEADECWVTAGANDATSGVTSAAYAENMRAIVLALKNAGFVVRVIGVAPFASGHPTLATVQSLVVQYNAWLRRNIASLGGVFVDAFSVLTDSSNANGAAVSGLINATDYTHYTHMGARLVGDKIAASYESAVAASASALILSRNDSYATSPLMPNIHPFDLGSSSGGTISDVVSGTAMDGLNISSSGNAGRTAVASVVSANSGIGNAQQVVFTPAASGDTLTVQQETGGTMAARVVPGERYQFKTYIKLSGATGANLQYIRNRIQGTFDAVSGIQIGGINNTYTTTDFDGDDTLILISPPVVIPPFSACTALTSEIILGFSAVGTALTVQVERVSMDRIS